MESIVLICTIIGGIAGLIAIISYRKDHIDKPKEELEFLKIQFMSTRSLSISVSNQLDEYCKKFNAHNELIFPGVTVEKYISLLKESQETNLSENILHEALKLSLTAPIIASMTKSLENQFNELLKLGGWVKAKMA